MSQFDIQITNNQTQLPIQSSLLITAVERVLVGAGVERAQISLAIVDNQQIHTLNRDHLQHDYPTDVLSFLFESNPTYVDGEVIVSAEMARQVAAELNVPPQNELVLYVVHGTLHLVGHHDQQPDQRAQMVIREQQVLAELGIAAPDRTAATISADDAATHEESRP